MGVWQLVKMLFSLFTLRSRIKRSVDKGMQGWRERHQAMHAMLAVYRKGDYEGALREVEGIESFKSSEGDRSYRLPCE
jgi:hypothetical protein